MFLHRLITLLLSRSCRNFFCANSIHYHHSVSIYFYRNNEGDLAFLTDCSWALFALGLRTTSLFVRCHCFLPCSCSSQQLPSANRVTRRCNSSILFPPANTSSIAANFISRCQQLSLQPTWHVIILKLTPTRHGVENVFASAAINSNPCTSRLCAGVIGTAVHDFTN